MILFTCISENTFYFDWEVTFMEWIQAHMGTFGLDAASFFSLFGGEIVTLSVLGLLYWCVDKELGRKVWLTFLFASALNPIFKSLFLRRRPYCDHTAIKCLRPVAEGADVNDLSVQGYSFPSGHSTNSVSLFSSIAINKRNKALAAIGITLPLFCGFSRICLGVHYPTDVLGGWLLGLAAIFAVNWLERWISGGFAYYALLVCMTVPGWLFCHSADYYTSFGILVGFVFAQEFERRYVGFENTRKPLRCLLRLGGGMAMFIGLRILLRQPFSEEFLVADTVPLKQDKDNSKFTVLSMTGLFADVIDHIYHNEPVSDLFIQS